MIPDFEFLIFELTTRVVHTGPSFTGSSEDLI
jgi:hypothetical protein